MWDLGLRRYTGLNEETQSKKNSIAFPERNFLESFFREEKASETWGPRAGDLGVHLGAESREPAVLVLRYGEEVGARRSSEHTKVL